MAREVITLGPPKPVMCNWLMVVLILTAVNSVCLLTIIVIISLKSSSTIPQLSEAELAPPITYIEYLKLYRDGELPRRNSADLLTDDIIETKEVKQKDEEQPINGIGDNLINKFQEMLLNILKDRFPDFSSDYENEEYDDENQQRSFPTPGNTFDQDLQKALKSMKIRVSGAPAIKREELIPSRPPALVESRINPEQTTLSPIDCPEAQSKLCINWREKQFCAIAPKFCQSLCSCDKIQ